MRGKFLALAERIFADAFRLNEANIQRALAGSCGTLVDCGCGDGSVAARIMTHARFEKAVGIEIDEQMSCLAEEAGLEVLRGDLNETIPLPDGCAGAVVANQVIEHLRDTDRFLSEIRRILKPHGRMVLSTENISSWHNIVAIMFGWQPFSLTNISSISSSLGNPFSLRRGKDGLPAPMQHFRIFSPRCLRELSQAHGFEVLDLSGAGYFPFTGRVAETLCARDGRHSIFITLSADRTPD